MGWIVMKVSQDPTEDRWCLWSSIAEGPIFDGTEEQMTRRYLAENGQPMHGTLAKRIERAKVHGGGTEYMGDWGDPLMMNSEGGMLPRHKLGALLDVEARGGTRAEVRALLEPFND